MSALRFAETPLLDFIPAVSPHLSTPWHFKRITDLFERADGGKLRTVISAPCQHGKTTLVLHAIAWWLVKNPKLKIIYASYGQEFSSGNSREARRLAKDCGLEFSEDHNTIKEWRLADGGGLLATSVDGSATGHSAQLVVIDDPFKNREEAENPERRELVDNWFRSVVLTRLSPSASVFVVASRWHDNDLSGRLIERGWEELRLSAINDDGADPTRPLGGALCPQGPDPNDPRDIAFLEGMRKEIGDYDFESLFQGRPRPRSGQMFRDVYMYQTLPTLVAIVNGVDLAYSASARSDYTAKVTLGLGVDFNLYVIHVQRWKTSLNEYAPELIAACTGSQTCSYISGNERGHLETMQRSYGFEIIGMPARYSKAYRAQETARDWNAGKILLKEGAPWVGDFVKEIRSFTGLENSKDDQVDALVSARDLLMGAAVAGSSHGEFLHGKRCM